MSSGIPNFPQVLPGQTVVGRLSSLPGSPEAIPLDYLDRVFNKTVSVTQFGTGLGDGSDWTAAFQKAAAFFGTVTAGPFQQKNGGTLRVPRGVYFVNAQTLFNVPGVRIVGEGVEATKIYVTGNLGASNALFKWKQTNAGYSNVGCGIEGVFIDMQGFTGHGIWMMKPYDGVTLKNVIVNGVADANNAYRIEPDPANITDSISQTVVGENIQARHLNNTATAPLFVGIKLQEATFIESKMFGCSDPGKAPCNPWYFEDCRAIKMYGGAAAFASAHGILANAVTRDVDLVLIDGMTFETNDGAVKTLNTGAFRVRHLVVRAPRFEGAVTNASGDFDLNGAPDAIIEARGHTVDIDVNSSVLSILATSAATVTSAAAVPLGGYQRLARLGLGVLNPTAELDIKSGGIIAWAGGTSQLLHAPNLLSLEGAAFVFNGLQATLDLRLAGHTDANLLYLQSSTDRIGIGIATPGFKFSIIGTLSLSSGANENGDGTLRLASGAAGAVTFAGSSSTGNLVVNAANTVGGLIILQSRGAERMRIIPGSNPVWTSGTTTPETLGANGEWTWTPTANGNMRISYRGSDGVTRVGNITLV